MASQREHKFLGDTLYILDISIELLERMIKLILKAYQCGERSKLSLVGYDADEKEMGWLQKENKQKPQDRQLKAISSENRECTTKQMKKKWVEIGVNVFDRNRLNEMDLPKEKPNKN